MCGLQKQIICSGKISKKLFSSSSVCHFSTKASIMSSFHSFFFFLKVTVERLLLISILIIWQLFSKLGCLFKLKSKYKFRGDASQLFQIYRKLKWTWTEIQILKYILGFSCFFLNSTKKKQIHSWGLSNKLKDVFTTLRMYCISHPLSCDIISGTLSEELISTRWWQCFTLTLHVGLMPPSQCHKAFPEHHSHTAKHPGQLVLIFMSFY